MVQNIDACDFVLIAPLPEERDALLKRISNYRRLNPDADDVRVYYSANIRTSFPDGRSAFYRVIIVTPLGMGRLEAAHAASDAIRRWKPKHVLVVGIAGGLGKAGVNLGDILIADQVADYELQKLLPNKQLIRWQVHRVDPRMLGHAKGFRNSNWMQQIKTSRPASGEPQVHFGAICSGDKVIANGLADTHREVWERLVGVEMEAGGVASAVFQSTEKPGFFMVRAVSDLADETIDNTKNNPWWDYACDCAAAYAIDFISNGPLPVEPERYVSANSSENIIEVKGHLWKPHYPKRSFRERERCGM